MMTLLQVKNEIATTQKRLTALKALAATFTVAPTNTPSAGGNKPGPKPGSTVAKKPPVTAPANSAAPRAAVTQ